MFHEELSYPTEPAETQRLENSGSVPSYDRWKVCSLLRIVNDVDILASFLERSATADWGQCRLVSALLSPEVLRSLVPAPPKGGTPWPFSSSWQCQYAHSSNNGWLSQWERVAAAAVPTVFARPLSLRLLPISRSKETNEGYPVWERRWCMWSVGEGCWRHTQINLDWAVEQVVSLHGKVLSCWRKIRRKKWRIFFFFFFVWWVK